MLSFYISVYHFLDKVFCSRVNELDFQNEIFVYLLELLLDKLKLFRASKRTKSTPDEPRVPRTSTPKNNPLEEQSKHLLCLIDNNLLKIAYYCSYNIETLYLIYI